MKRLTTLIAICAGLMLMAACGGPSRDETAHLLRYADSQDEFVAIFNVQAVLGGDDGSLSDMVRLTVVKYITNVLEDYGVSPDDANFFAYTTNNDPWNALVLIDRIHFDDVEDILDDNGWEQDTYRNFDLL